MTRRLVAEPVKAWKRARLVLGRDGEVAFRSVSADCRYGTLSVAECRPPTFGPPSIDHDGPAPHEDCSCGFYANKDRVDPRSHSQVLLEVDLSGTVVVHERGYRAERQQVMAVHVLDTCSDCGDPAVVLSTRGPGGGDTVWPFCADCAYEPSFGLADLAGMLGVSCRWIEEWDAPSSVSVQVQAITQPFMDAMRDAMQATMLTAQQFSQMVVEASNPDGDPDLSPLGRKRRRDEERRQRLEALDGPKRAPKRIGGP